MNFNLDKYLQKVRAKGRYSITLSELKKDSRLSDKAIQQSIFRAKKGNKLAQVRQGFYIIIPPEYSASGILPIYHFIDDLMVHLKRNYYISLYSAAILDGAGHQQTMSHQLFIERPALRSIKTSKLTIDFYTKNAWNENAIVLKKTETGYIKVSSPELTALDIINYHNKIGGISRTLPILEDLCEVINPNKLFETAVEYKNNVAVQRLGFLLDNAIEESELADSLYPIIENNKTNKVALSSLSSQSGEANTKWNVIINTETEY